MYSVQAASSASKHMQYGVAATVVVKQHGMSPHEGFPSITVENEQVQTVPSPPHDHCGAPPPPAKPPPA
jgi:hypothetical protein